MEKNKCLLSVPSTMSSICPHGRHVMLRGKKEATALHCEFKRLALLLRVGD